MCKQFECVVTIYGRIGKEKYTFYQQQILISSLFHLKESNFTIFEGIFFYIDSVVFFV
ncbi:hypothetical protein BDC45DRAFT_518846 [Circinella umbellata]|nr:hypothetical protein BDC45DRAFT_518846 [Circinella umbellata]